MARVTVEDCVLQIPNRFELVMLAAHRARSLGAGAELKVDRDRDKNPVVALREIADQKLDLKNVEEALVKSLQLRIEPDRPEEEDEAAEIMSSEQQSWINDMGPSEEEDDLEDSDMDEDAEVSEESEASFDSGSFEDAVIKD